MSTIYIMDVTNRDGVQTSRLGLSKLQKTIINLMMNKMGVAQSEFGFPFTNHEKHYLNANLKLHKKGVLKPMILSGWCTSRSSDVKKSFSLVPELKYINISLSTSDQMIKGKFGGKKTFQDIIIMVTKCVKQAYRLGAKHVAINAEDSSRTRLKNLIEFGRAGKKAGAKRFRYCDTLGFDDPRTIYDRVYKLGKELRMDLELHCHNDLGMAVANSIAGAQGAIDAGVDVYINTTINGMGERAGNADMVSVILGILKASGLRIKYHLDKKIDLSNCWELSKYASYAFGIPLPINQPGVGANAFAHESGIHADGALKDRKNYELYDFKELGRGEPELIETGRQITVGEYSGIKGFRNVYEKLEVKFANEKEACNILELARYANVHNQLPLTKQELLFIARYPEIARKIMTVSV